MKFIITESRLKKVMTKFMDDYLSKYEVRDDGKIVAWGEGQNNQMVYDVEMEVLFVREDMMRLFRDMFSLDHHEYVVFIKDYMADKGYFVERLV